MSMSRFTSGCAESATSGRVVGVRFDALKPGTFRDEVECGGVADHSGDKPGVATVCGSLERPCGAGRGEMRLTRQH